MKQVWASLNTDDKLDQLLESIQGLNGLLRSQSAEAKKTKDRLEALEREVASLKSRR